MKIRAFTKSDLAAILAIQKDAPQAAQWQEADYARLADDSAGMILVAELKIGMPPKILGFAALQRVMEEAELRNLAVDPGHRSRGIGKSLLDEAHKRLLKAGAKKVYLEVRASNDLALRLYDSLGFSVHSVRKDYYQDPREDAIVLSLELRPPDCRSSGGL